MAAAGELLEWAEFAGNLYGTPRRPSNARLADGQPVLLKIDLQGARQVRQAMPEAQLVFLAPPSWEELERRLIGRGTDDPATIQARVWTTRARRWRPQPDFDVTIVNHFVEQAADDLLALLGSPMTQLS